MIKKFTEDFNNIFIDMECPSRIGIALSGGADSMALLMLLKYWVDCERSCVKIFAVTVDHSLRENSHHEAYEISEFCTKNNISHQILKWEHGEITSGTQEKARNARYTLLSTWAKDNEINVILTAHHLGDQIEQILISLSKGAGIYSYHIKKFSTIKNILFVRPLLEYSKDDLRKYLVLNHIPWWEDPSNKDKKYLRNKLRNIAEVFLEISDKKRVTTSISNIQRASAALNDLSDMFINVHVNISNLGYAKFNIKSYYSQSDEVRFSVLRKLILQIGAQKQDIRINSIITVDNAIKLAKSKTLGGCEILFIDDLCIIIREFGRNFPQTVIMEKTIVWDNRFIASSTYANHMINYINKYELHEILKIDPSFLDFDKNLPKKIKIKILLTLPSIRRLEKLVAIPHISYYSDLTLNRKNIITNINIPN